MSEFTDQLKAKADLGKLIGEFVALKPGGSGYIGLCPFHGEKTPSFHVHSAKRFYYCFGCHAHGDIYRFLMEFKKLSFPEAVEAVAERLGIPVPQSSAAEADPQRQALLAIHAAAAEFFVRELASPPGAVARAYLQSRELAPATAARFGLGYAPETGRALTQFLHSRGFPPGLALRSGLCQMRRESQAGLVAPAQAAWPDLYDRFRQRLMFPIADERGRVIAFGGRNLLEPADPRTPKYLNSPEHPLYTKGRVLYNLDRARDAIRELGYVILVEGYFDCIRVFAAGFGNVVASCGTALTSAQVGSLRRLCQKAVINFDPDAAGAAAAERSIGLLLEEGFQMRVVVLEAGQDPDVFVRRNGRDAYAAALKASRSFFDYLAGRARRQFDLRRGEGKVAAINHLLPYLGRVHDPILRQNLAENLAAELGLEHSLVSQQLVRAARDRRAALPAAATRPVELLAAEKLLLRTWAELPNRRADFAAWVLEEKLLEALASAPLAELLAGISSEEVDFNALAERLEPSDRQLLAQILIAPEEEEPLTPAVLAGALEALRERRQAETLRSLPRLIQQAAAAGDRGRVEELLRQKAAWDRAKSGSR